MTCQSLLKLSNQLKTILRSSISVSNGKSKTPLEDYASSSLRKTHFASSSSQTLRSQTTETSLHKSAMSWYQPIALDALISSINLPPSANGSLGVFQRQSYMEWLTVSTWERQSSLRSIGHYKSTSHQLFVQIRNHYTNASSNQAPCKKNDS